MGETCASCKPFITEEDGVLKVRTCAWSPPGDHPVGCGMFIHVKDGKIVKVEGDPSHPITQGRLCPRCIALDEVVYHKDRLLSPMKRAREDRGKDAWEKISWDEAYDLLEEKIRGFQENYGAECIFTLTGTGRESTLYAPVYGPAIMNTPNGASTYPFSGEACYGPRATIVNYLLGAGVPEIDSAQFFPDRYDDPRWVCPKYIMVWGKDPLYSSPDGFFGHSIIDIMKRGAKIITVDPRLTWLGAHSEYHLQLRPGTDAAVGMGFLNVIISEDLYDHDFVEKWCYGFEELSEAVKPWTPEKVQEVSWVDPEQLVGAARAFATNAPSTATWGVALDQSKQSTQAAQCFMAICAICGYIDVPGGITITKPTSFIGQWRYDMSDTLTEGMAEKHIVDPTGKYRMFNTGAAMGGVQGDTLLNWLEGMYKDYPEYYPLRMCWLIGSNPLACMADQPQRWYAAMKDLDFIVAQDIFMTPTIMGLCDLVLPLSTFAEHDGLVTPNYGRNQHFVGAMNTAVENPNTKSDLEILVDMGKRMRPEIWGDFTTIDDFFDTKLKRTTATASRNCAKSSSRPTTSTASMRRAICAMMGSPVSRRSPAAWSCTPTCSRPMTKSQFPILRNPTTAPCPNRLRSWRSIRSSIPRAAATSAPSTPSTVRFPRCALHPDPLVTINPATAEKYGIREGDWVRVDTMFGKCTQKAHLTYEVNEKTIHVEHAWWFPEQDGEAPNLFGVFDANANNLIPHESVGVTGYGAPYKNGICSITRVDSMKD